MDTALSIMNVIGDLTGPIGTALAIVLAALHLKNAGHITTLFNTVAGVSKDVALTAQTVRMNHAALPTAIAAGVAQVAQDAGVPAKVMQQVQAGAAQAAALLPAGEALLTVEAPSVEQHVHSVLDQVSQVAVGLAQLTKQMQAMPVLTGVVAMPPAPAPAQAGG